MSCVFQNSDPPPPSPPGECVPPAFVAGGGHTRRVERGVGGHYFGRRKTQLCTLPISNPLWIIVYIVYQSFCPCVGIGSPHPFPRKRVCPSRSLPHLVPRERGPQSHSLGGGGRGGDPIPTKGQRWFSMYSIL
jgi:hypothetical protein